MVGHEFKVCLDFFLVVGPELLLYRRLARFPRGLGPFVEGVPVR